MQVKTDCGLDNNGKPQKLRVDSILRTTKIGIFKLYVTSSERYQFEDEMLYINRKLVLC